MPEPAIMVTQACSPTLIEWTRLTRQQATRPSAYAVDLIDNFRSQLSPRSTEPFERSYSRFAPAQGCSAAEVFVNAARRGPRRRATGLGRYFWL